MTINLANVHYSPGFHTNIVSLRRLTNKGLFWSLDRRMLYVKDERENVHNFVLV